MKLTPKKWASFQHYKNRVPPWIKLHRALLDDRLYQRLPLASRALAPMLWLLASEHEDGIFEASLDELSFRLRQGLSEINEGLQPLVAAGFFEIVEGDASTVLADRKQLATPEAEEIRGRAEADETSAPSALHHQAALDGIHPAAQQTVASKKLVPECPHQEIIQLWGEKLPSAVQPRTWTGSRAAALKARWCEDRKRQNLEWWAGLFEHIGDSDFLMGRTSSHGRTPFMVSLDWLCKAENFAKTLDGQYDRKEPQAASLLVGAI